MGETGKQAYNKQNLLAEEQKFLLAGGQNLLAKHQMFEKFASKNTLLKLSHIGQTVLVSIAIP